MLVRLLIASVVLAVTHCAAPNQTKFVGDWKWQGEDEVGQIHFSSDQSFRMDTHGWTTPPVLHENGVWRVKSNDLVLDFESPYRPKPDEKHITLAILRVEPDRISMRSYDRKKTFTLERTR